MTATEDAIRRPVNTNGSAPGTVTVRVIWLGVAAYARSRSRCTGWTWRRPRSVLTNTGANTTTATMSRRGVVDVVPNMVLSTGASATIGMTDTTAAVGVMPASNQRLRAARIAATTAATPPTTRPTSTFVPVATEASHTSGATVRSCSPIAVGLGSRYGLMPAATTSTCHANSASRPTTTGGTQRRAAAAAG